MSDIPDPFGENRRADGVLSCPFTGEEVLMILRHGDVKRAAKDCSVELRCSQATLYTRARATYMQAIDPDGLG